MSRIRKVLIANRGEIAVRIIRAAADSGIASVAVYADQDRDALHSQLADESYALGGSTSADSYLAIDKILSVARRSGADAVHPGYGFLAENADFARAVIGAGLTWIGPSPEAIERLGDKVSARHVAEKVNAPLAPGTSDPVQGADEVLAFADEVGLPVAIKAAFGGGGRGLKVAYKREEVADLFESATREAVAAFGRGECFVEKYLEKPRHVETQCLADSHGNVVVISTRDCSLQRRHQKLVEEAPAPFLSDAQNEELYAASKAILREVGYVGAGTCEFLVAKDGTISFLEVNTRLQVEHPVSEEVTGIDLVREQFRIAEGGVLDYEDPVAHGHSFEFRLNGEDPGNGFLPAPGPVSLFKPALGPGVRVDTGVQSGDVISGAFDSMLGKLIVTGATREEALERSRRALDELEVQGLPTVLPFHRKIVRDPAFTAEDGTFGVYTLWIESEFVNDIEPWEGENAAPSTPSTRQAVVVEVAGRRVEVTMPTTLLPIADQDVTRGPAPKRAKGSGVATATGDSVSAPMQATVVKLAVEDGQEVAEGELIVVLEAMKMEQSIYAHRSGIVCNIDAPLGQTVPSGHPLLSIVDAV
ncbi:Carbamoyl-phosphate synthase large chain [Leucobacter aridicollis]|uniref:biotin carboxylase n=1 Tax=Leucobacter aridicollis TaxID=283878 RepID=A0A852QT04_9MICO|nr:biotin carboxylase N-terminal domain-containing protein [Leucobacter aridicollis]MBL3683106.1 ATP-grasp domain-containing protein [Leucobacter aridicollis]MCS3428736.1 acetyl-CoA/propionyl-CoA carboxylase biotin carboxyl carrier protein [Leucobacter aridicollis]NYD25333.1 acetyl-CoA/propionyl-CoA carboxylase biotin carboxyl carrier protein [Leucobacter aridicollis]RKQ89903.1 acetyl/propionyl-CoA carboxylase alpha subunit [Mycolicibacterium mucogenicum 261Sha1.1M5]